MISSFTDVLQKSVQPEDMAESISAFFASNLQSIRTVCSKIAEYLNDEISLSDLQSQLITNEGIVQVCMSLKGTSTAQMSYVYIADLCSGFNRILANDSEVSDVRVVLNKLDGSSGGTIPVSEVLDRLNDMLTTGEAIIATCEAFADWTVDTARDFYSTVSSRVEGIISTASPKLAKIKSALANVAISLGDTISSSTPDTLKAILHALGLPASSGSVGGSPEDTYSDLPALSCVLNEFFQKVSWVTNKVQQVLVAIPLAIMRGIDWMCQGVYHGIHKAAIKIMNTILNTGNSLAACTIPGKGFISHPGFGFRGKDMDNPYTQYFNDAYDEFMSALGSGANQDQNYTVPFGPLLLFLKYDPDDRKVTLSYDVAPMQYPKVRELFASIFDAELPLMCYVDGGAVKERSDSGIYQLDVEKVVQFLSEISANPQTYYGLSGDMDAEWWLSIQTARYIAGLYLCLALETSDATVISYDVSADVVSSWYHFNIALEPGYDSNLQCLEPSNLNTARLLTYFGIESNNHICFNDNVNYPNQNIVDISEFPGGYDWRYYSGSKMWAQWLHTITCVVFNSVAESQIYVPYFHKIKYYRPSYYVPTDQQNVATLKRMITTIFVVTAAIAAAILTIVIAKKAAYKVFALEAEAGNASWTAAENHDPTALKQAYRLQKKANLIARLAGISSTAATNSLSSLPASLTAVSNVTNALGVSTDRFDSVDNGIEQSISATGDLWDNIHQLVTGDPL